MLDNDNTPDQATSRKVRNYMRQDIDNCVDPQTNEVDCTKLAENAAQQFDLYLDDDAATIPDWVFDLAVDVNDTHG